MTYFAPCPRCKTGALMVVNDLLEQYLKCVNCSREAPIATRDYETIAAPNAEVNATNS